MGDAAYPIGQNGATQGIIDARVLAWHLAKAASLDEALQHYEEDRREATAKIVLMNLQLGPDRVLGLAAERLAKGAHEKLLPMEEREEIALSYLLTAGFGPTVHSKRAGLSDE